MVLIESESGESIKIVGEPNLPTSLQAKVEIDEEIGTSPASMLKNQLLTKSGIQSSISQALNQSQAKGASGTKLAMMNKSNEIVKLGESQPSNGHLSMQSMNQEEIEEMELEETLDSIKERMLMNQMPSVGDLRSNDPKDVKQRIRAIQALLRWKENKSVEIR